MQSSSKKVTLLILAAVILLTAMLWFRQRKNSNEQQKDFALTAEEYGDKGYARDELPPNIPADLPKIKSGDVFVNTSSISPSNIPGIDSGVMVQSVRKITVSGSIQENEHIYKDYLEKNGYTITATSSKNTIALTGRKGYGSLTIVISNYNMATGTSILFNSSMFAQKK